MSWLRRILLLAGLVTGAWLLGSSGQAQADIRVEIDQLKIEVELPVVDVGVQVDTGLVPRQPETPLPPVTDPHTEPPAPVVSPQKVPEPPVAVAQPLVHVEAPAPHPPLTTTRPTNSHQPVPQQPQPQAEPPITGTLPQSSGAGQSGGTQIPVGTLPAALRPPVTTTSLVSTEQQDSPRIVHAEEPTFSPD